MQKYELGKSVKQLGAKIDSTMLELMWNAPGKWILIENWKGEKLKQELGG